MPISTLADDFLDDSPQVNPWRDDKLGFGPFASRLATALVGIKAPSGYVIGLHGSWGSGKSTLLNFVAAYMTKRRDEGDVAYEAAQLIRFEPWIVSGYQDLAAAFFKQLSLTMADGAAKRASKRSRLGKAIKMGADPILDLAAVLGATIDHTNGTVSKAAAAVGKKGMAAIVDNWLAEPSLQATYEELAQRLRIDGRRYIVMIDDIDRLTDQEIRSIMQMVKTVGKLPNVIYLLAYDREIVWAALKEANDASSLRPHFAEKIIQHEIELPVPSRHALLGMLSAETAQIPAPPPDSMRWYDVVQAGINRWIRRPRDVARLANALRFAWPALEGEVDPQDLICMEGLRLFDREVYAWIRDQRDLLLNQAFPRSVSQAQQEEIGQRLKESLAEDKRDDVILLLKSLFPTTSKIFGKNERSFSQEPWFQIANRRGIATKPAFDAYFSLSLSAHEIPKELVDRAMNALDNEDAQIAYLEEALRKTDAFGNTLLGDYFQELIYRFAERGSNSSQALFNALIRSGDKVFGLDWKGDLFGPVANLHILMIRVLQKLGEAEAARVVEETLSKPGNLVTKCGLLVDQARQLGIILGGGSSREPALSHADLMRLAETLASKVEKTVENGDLDDAHAYYDVLRIFGLTGRNDKARTWSAHLALSSPHRLATLSNGFLGYSRTAGGKSYRFAEMPDAEIYDVDAIRQGLLLYCNATDIDDDERARLIAVDRGLAGTSNDD